MAGGGASALHASPPCAPSSPAPRPSLPVPAAIRPTSFLSVGQLFSGSQTVNSASPPIPSPLPTALPPTQPPTPFSPTPPPLLPPRQPHPHSHLQQEQHQLIQQHKDANNKWRVNVVIQGVDLLNGTVCGSMEALDVPKAVAPVVTFWTGEIIDNINHFFRTRRWGASLENDVKHWKRFKAFEQVLHLVSSDSADQLDLSQSRFIFMRWKEIFFVSAGEECNLTIAGFYYVCMDRHTGAVLGYYFDPKCQPYQRLQLNAVASSHGYAFPDYSFN